MTKQELMDVLYDVGAVLADLSGLDDSERVNSALHAAINGWMDRNGQSIDDSAENHAESVAILNTLLAKPPLDDFRLP